VISYIEFLSSSRNLSAIQYASQQLTLESIRTNQDPRLFGSTPPDPVAIEADPPVITFRSPLEGNIVEGTDVVVEAVAQDASGVAQLTVSLNGAALPDDDASAARFLGHFDSTAMTDGPATLTARASDVLGATSTAPIDIVVSNSGPKEANGQCAVGLAPLSGAQATLRTVPDGTTIGTATTSASGAYRITGIEGTIGYVELVCTSGTYEETAYATANPIGLSTGDELRVIVYLDGRNVNNLDANVFTTFAATYFDYLRGVGTPIDSANVLAHTALARVIDVQDLRGLRPAPLVAATTTLDDAAKLMLAEAGFSQESLVYAELAGVTPGSGLSSVTLWRAIEQDLASGCLDGLDTGGAAVTLARIALGPEGLRRRLAEGVAVFMRSSLNLSGLKNPANAIDFLDAISTAGGSTTGDDPLVCEVGTVLPAPGEEFDTDPPAITWDEPAAGVTLVAGSLTLQFTASDLIDPRPVASWGEERSDTDGDSTNATAETVIDTRTQTDEGVPLVVTAVATDKAGNIGREARSFTVDNTPPTLTVTSAPVENSWINQAPLITGTVSDPHFASLSATLDGVTYTISRTGDNWTATPTGTPQQGARDLVIVALDTLGNRREWRRTVKVDTVAPAITVAATTVYSEDTSTVTFNTTSGEASIMQGTLLTLGANSTSPGQAVTKFISQFRKEAATADTSGLAASYYTIRSPSGLEYGPIDLPVAGGTAYLTEVQVSARTGSGDVWSRLQTEPGTWLVRLHARDNAGNVKTELRYTTHTLLAPPVEVVKVDVPANSRAITGSTLEANTMAGLINGTTPATSVPTRYRLRNYNEQAVYVGFFVLTSASSYQGSARDQSVVLAETATSPGCDAWRINANNTTTCAGAGWTKPTAATTPIAGTYGVQEADNRLVNTVRLINRDSTGTETLGEARCTTGTCQQTITPSTPSGTYRYFEFGIPGRRSTDTTPVERYVSLELDNAIELNPVAGTPAEVIPKAARPTVTGELLEKWAQCLDPGECFDIQVLRRFKALTFGRISATDLRIAVRLRRDDGSGARGTPAAPAGTPVVLRPYFDDGATSSVFRFNFDFQTCEGTFVSGTCVPNLP
jgi:hypothetical protein